MHFFVHSVKVGEDASGPVFISLCFRSGLNGLVFFFFHHDKCWSAKTKDVPGLQYMLLIIK